MRKKQLILTVIGIIGLIIITAGVTLAFFSYTKTGTTENSITSGNITFLYTEDSKIGRGILLEDAMPMTDSQGKAQTGTGKVFEFSITSSTGNKIAIPYEITARKSSDSTLDENAVKVYLEKGNEEVLLSKYGSLPQTEQEVGTNIERTLYKGKIPKNSTNYSETFKLRMWIDENIDYSNGTYNDKLFKLTVNVYANGKALTEEDINLESNVGVNSLSVNDITLTAATPKNYKANLNYGTEEATINVEPTNPYTKVIIEKTDSTYENVISMNNRIIRLSTEKKVSLSNGNNYYRIRLISENGLNNDQLNLNIYVQEPSWDYEYDSTKTENSYTFLAQTSGLYKLETWGASGGSVNNYNGGYGGYSTGNIYLESGQQLYFSIGGAGKTGSNVNGAYTQGGYNGGGGNTASLYGIGSTGGGATHIALVPGVLSSLSDYKGTLNDNNTPSDTSDDYYVSNDILIVAAGGGGAGRQSGHDAHIYGGSGGGVSGVSSIMEDNDPTRQGNAKYISVDGATQISGATFGQGQEAPSWTGGGGGGFYGGYSYISDTRSRNGGSGGSGYIANPNLTDKSMYCFNCTESSNIQTFTVKTNGTSELRDTTNCPNGYSSDPVSKCAKAGNGYVKITYLGD